LSADKTDVLKQGIAAGLAGLGLIGGAATVAYNDDGDATVKIKDEKTGQVQTVHLAGGQSVSCPSGTSEKVEPHDIKIARIELTLRQVRREEGRIEQKYPGKYAPGPVIARYEALGRRDARLVEAFNAEVDVRNAILRRDCTAADS
jgi:hypothetical protein